MFRIRIQKNGNLNTRDEESTSANDAIETIYNFEDEVFFEFGDVEFIALLSGDISDSWLDILGLIEDLKSDSKNIKMQFPSQSFWHYWELNEIENNVWEIEAFLSHDKKKKITINKEIFQAEFQKLIDVVESDLINQGYDLFKFIEYSGIMKNEQDKILAWRKYPIPRGSNYYRHSLQQEFNVTVLFDFCQIMEATIFAEGWNFLISNYGLNKLYEIDKVSQWFDSDSKEEWLECFLYQTLISGINVQSGKYGNYNEENNLFETEDGNVEKINWEKFKSQDLEY